MSDPTFLTLEEALLIHESMIVLYGGSMGVRDQGLLDSALEMPKSTFGDEFLHRSVFEMAAAYLFHVVKNHPFVDGNKRAGLGCADLFLAMNDLDLRFSEDEAVALTMKVASESITKAEIADILEINCMPASN